MTLFIGLALLAVFVIRREYGFLVPGSILTGVGIGIALEPATSGDTESGVMMLALAGGFLGIWVIGSLYRLPQNHWWPLIPGGILTLIGLVQLSRTDVEGALRLWPVILIILGALVLGRTISRRTVVRHRVAQAPRSGRPGALRGSLRRAAAAPGDRRARPGRGHPWSPLAR